MLWCPIVKNQKSGSKHNQINDVAEVKNKIKTKYGIELETIINEKFMDCFKELRKYAGTDKKENKSPVIRLLQIEEFLKKYLEKQ